MTDTLIVTGASGKLGRSVLAHLKLIHQGPIIATSRDPSRIADLPDVDGRRADFGDPATLAPAFAGGDRLLLISTDAVGADGLRLKQHRSAITAAVEAGISHIVYTSLTNPEPGAAITIAPDHFGTEQALAASGVKWTSLRDNLYADLLIEFLGVAVRTGVLAAAAGDGAVGWVTREDCARTAAAVLAAPPSASGVLDVTGPALIGYGEVAAIASRVLGREISYEPLTEAGAAAAFAHAPLPPEVRTLLLSFQVAAANGELAVLSDTVEKFTGQAPVDVETFLAANVARLQARS